MGTLLIELALLPSGHLALLDVETQAEAEPALLESHIPSLRGALAAGSGDFLIHLATRVDRAALSQVFLFWRGLGERYLTELCHIPETAEKFGRPLPVPVDELPAMVESAPPMHGGEYLSVATVSGFWTAMDEHARNEIALEKGGLGEWLKRRSPLWHRVGRVCFHLAENKQDPEYPFAFLATYAPKLLDGRKVQYQPLGRALEEYAGAKNKQTLVNLLTPVQRAAERCTWIKKLVDSGEVFHPLAWTPQEAHRFLQDVPLVEESGLLVRVPDWWSRRASRLKVGVSIGQKRQSKFNADALLDFNVEMTLDGESLTRAEWEEILKSSESLVFLKGKWVEVDREKLTRALEHWKQVEKETAGDGISFLQGMRLLAGASIDSEHADVLEGENAAWSEIRAGKWLEERLREIRQPETLQSALPGEQLRATLRPYQETGVKWLWFLSNLGLGACLADDMGLGKTVQVLALLLMRKKQSQEKLRLALLVLPASLLGNWKTEIEKFAPSLKCTFIHPSQMPSAQLKAAGDNPQEYLADTDVVLTTYSMLIRQPWLNSIEWDLAVLDEAQAIKNPAARQTRAVKQLKTQGRIVLTGTPVENRLSDLWSLFDFINPGLLGSVKAFGEFVKRLERRPAEQFAPLRKLAGPYILRRLKTDKSIIADLPDKIELQAFCYLTKTQAALYEQSVRELAQTLNGKSGIERRGAVLAFILRFKQICNHPAQWTASGLYTPEESGKFQRLRAICEELAARQEKALVFTQFREITEPIASFLKTVFGRPGLVLHGGTHVGKRKKIVDEFQNEGGPPFLVLSLKAGGIGLNLTAATHVIHFDRWWNPAVENQATDRAFRIGQKRNVMVHKFVCQGTIEEKIDELIRDKTKLASEILEGGVPSLITEMGDKELLNLVRLDVNALEED